MDPLVSSSVLLSERQIGLASVAVVLTDARYSTIAQANRNQIITIASNALTSPAAPFATPQRVKIVSITPDHGLLRTVLVDVDRNGKEVFGGGGSAKRQFIDLQPDGNSFDMLAGLIKTKTLQ